MDKGQIRRRWIKTFERNEALDLRVYNLAAYDVLKPNISKVRSAVISATAPTVKETTEYKIKEPAVTRATVDPRAVAPKPAPRVRVGRGFIGGSRKGWL